nr:MAG TPA: hypothetical protein [Caudoviricetes sp.]
MAILDKFLIFKGFEDNSIIPNAYYLYITLKIFECFK